MAGAPVRGWRCDSTRAARSSGGSPAWSRRSSRNGARQRRGRGFGASARSERDHEGNYRLEHLAARRLHRDGHAGRLRPAGQGQATLEPGAPETRLDLQFETGADPVRPGRAGRGAGRRRHGLRRGDRCRATSGWSQTDTRGLVLDRGAGGRKLPASTCATSRPAWPTTRTVELATSSEIVIEIPTAPRRRAGRRWHGRSSAALGRDAGPGGYRRRRPRRAAHPHGDHRPGGPVPDRAASATATGS